MVSEQRTVTIPRALLARVYLCLDWICGEGLGPWPPESAPDPDELYLEIGAIVNPEGRDATDFVQSPTKSDAGLVAEQRDEIERLRSGLQWILDNIDHQKAPLIVGRAKAALHV